MKKRVKTAKSTKVKRRVKVKRQAVALELLHQEERLWHYTSWAGLVGILGNQAIVPKPDLTSWLFEPGYYMDPLSGIWCSYAQEIERALPGMLIKDLVPTTRAAQEHYASRYGLARIRVTSGSAPFTVGEPDGLEPAEFLVDDVVRMGSPMENWRIGHCAIPSTNWLAVEFWDYYGGWISVADARQPLLRSLWPLLPLWMRAEPTKDTFDPDYLPPSGQIDRNRKAQYVERFDIARSSFWLLMLDGAVNGAFVLAHSHAELSASLLNLSPLDQAASQADLALWYRFRGQDEQADALTWRAGETLYGRYGMSRVMPELGGAGFRFFMEQLVRTSPSLGAIRCAELVVPVAIHLMLCRRAEGFSAKVNEMCNVISDLCPENPVVHLMVAAISRWLGSRRIKLNMGDDDRLRFSQVLPLLAPYYC